MGKNKILLYSRFSCSHHVKLSSTFAANAAPLEVGANVEDSLTWCEPKI